MQDTEMQKTFVFAHCRKQLNQPLAPASCKIVSYNNSSQWKAEVSDKLTACGCVDVLSARFDLLEESFSCKEIKTKQFCPPMKTSCPAVENINEFPGGNMRPRKRPSSVHGHPYSKNKLGSNLHLLKATLGIDKRSFLHPSVTNYKSYEGNMLHPFTTSSGRTALRACLTPPPFFLITASESFLHPHHPL